MPGIFPCFVSRARLPSSATLRAMAVIDHKVEQQGVAAIHPDGRKRWTVEEVYRIVDLFPGERWELIEGDIIRKMPQKPPHAYAVKMMVAILVKVFGALRVQSQMPVRLPEPEGLFSEPEPDVALLKREITGFRDHHPGPEDVSLLVEVSDTTLHTDREIKCRLYANAGIPEYWIVDIPNRRLYIHRDPAGGDYKFLMFREEDEIITSPDVPGCTFCLNDLLP